MAGLGTEQFNFRMYSATPVASVVLPVGRSVAERAISHEIQGKNGTFYELNVWKFTILPMLARSKRSHE